MTKTSEIVISQQTLVTSHESRVTNMSFRCAFTIRSDTRYLSLLRKWIEAAATLMGESAFPRRAVIPCSLALIEAVDNAIFHAHARRAHLPIEVGLAVSRGVIEIDIVDQGTGIDHTPVCQPEAMVTHGRGLFLIHELMHDVQSHKDRGRHRLHMTYRL